MTIFAVIALDYDLTGQLKGAVEAEFQNSHFQVVNGHYLINATGTAQEIAVQLDIPGGHIGRVIVYNIAGYFGYAPTNTWEWLKTYYGAPSG